MNVVPVLALLAALAAPGPALAGDKETSATVTGSRYSSDVVLFVTWRSDAPSVFVGDCPGGTVGSDTRVRFTSNRYEADLEVRLTTNRRRADHVFCTD